MRWSHKGLIEQLAFRLLSASVRQPWTVLVTVSVALAMSVFLAGRVELRLDGRSLIPRGDPGLAASDAISAEFGPRPSVLLAQITDGPTLFAPAPLRRLAHLGERLGKVRGIDPGSVVSLLTVPRLFIERDTIDTAPYSEALRVADPDICRRISYEARVLGWDNGVLLSRDGRAAAVYAELAPAQTSIACSGTSVPWPPQSRAAVIACCLPARCAQAVLGRSVATDLSRLIPLVIAVLVLVLTLAFRRPAPALLAATEVGVSLILMAGLMGAVRQPVFVTTLVLPVILLVIGVTDDVYALAHYFGRSDPGLGRTTGELVIATFVEMAQPVTLTTATTSIGLLSLTTSSLEPQRVFGFYGAVSIGLSTLMLFTVVPALIVLLDLRPRAAIPRARRRRGAIVWLARTLGDAGLSSPRAVAALALVSAFAAAAIARSIRVEDSWLGNLPTRSDIVTDDCEIGRRLAGTTTLEVLADGAATGALLDPAVFAELSGLADRLRALPEVSAVEGLFADVARVNAAIAGEPSACERSLSGRDEVGQALMLLGSVGENPLPRRFDREYRRGRITVFVRDANYTRLGRVLAAVGDAPASSGPPCPGPKFIPFGDGWVSYMTVRLLVQGQVQSLALAILGDAVVVALMFHSFRAAVVVLAPVLWSVMIVFAAMAATGTPLGIANSMFAAIGIGVGIDYSIHLLAAFKCSRASNEPIRATTSSDPDRLASRRK